MPGGGARHPATHETVDQRHALRADEGQRGLQGRGADVRGVRRDDPRRATASPRTTWTCSSRTRRTSASSRPPCKRVNLPMDRVFVNVDRYGNTGAASVYVAMEEAIRRRPPEEGRPGAARRLRRRLRLGRRAPALVTVPSATSGQIRPHRSLPGPGLARRVGMGPGSRPEALPERRAPSAYSRKPTTRSASRSHAPLLRGPGGRPGAHRQHPARGADRQRGGGRGLRRARPRAGAGGRAQPRRVLGAGGRRARSASAMPSASCAGAASSCRRPCRWAPGAMAALMGVELGRRGGRSARTPRRARSSGSRTNSRDADRDRRPSRRPWSARWRWPRSGAAARACCCR